MSTVLRFILRQNVALNIAFVAIMIFGIFVSLKNIPIDQFPSIDMGTYSITTVYPGASPENVERLVTEEIESAIRNMEGIGFIRSTSITGLSNILIQFEDGADYDSLYADLRMRVLAVQGILPVVNGQSVLPIFTINDIDEWLPVIQVNVQHVQSHQHLQLHSLGILVKELRSLLERIPDVKSVILFGVEDQQYELSIDPVLLNRYGMTMAECVRALRAAGHNIPGGSLETDNGELAVILDDVAKTPDDIFDIVVRTDEKGNHITLQSVIDWKHTGPTRILGGFRTSFNGKDSVGCKVIKTSQGNAARIKEQVIEICDTFIAAHADDHIEYITSLDSTHAINDSMGTLATSLIAACVLVVLTLFWFLGHVSKRTLVCGTFFAVVTCALIAWVESSAVRSLALVAYMLYIFYHNRSSALVFSGIAFSFIGSIIFFDFAGYSLNEITLLGFVLTIGIIVDDAIIVLENIRRHYEAGEEIHVAAVNGTAEVFWPIVSATLSTLAAFLPMLLMTGTAGEFFSLVPIAVSIALFVSLVECVIFLPVHTVDLSRVLGPEKVHHNQGHSSSHLDAPGFTGRMHRIYEKLLRWVFAHPLVSMCAMVFLFLLSLCTLAISDPKTATELGISPPLRVKFFPSDPRQLWIRVSAPHGSSAQSIDATCREIAVLLNKRPVGEVDYVITTTGMNIDSSYNMSYSHQNAFIIVELSRGKKRTFSDPNEVLSAINQQLQSSFVKRGYQISVEAKMEGPPVDSPVHVQIHGADDAVVERLAYDMYAWIQSQMHTGGKFAGIKDLYHDREQEQDQLHFHFDSKKLANVGISPLRAQEHVSSVFNGSWVGNLRQLNKDIPIRVKISQRSTQDVSSVLSLPISNDVHGGVVHFYDIGYASVDTVPSVLVRRGFQRAITINGTLYQDGIYSHEFVDDWYQEHKESYIGASISFDGESAGTSRSYQSLIISFFLAMFLIYVILASQFKSYIQPLIIMSNIVFSIVAVVLVMAVFGIAAQLLGSSIIRPERSWFTMQCIMAIIGLAGLVVNDAIVLIHFINQRRLEGLPLREALFTAGHQRLRAIMMTTITTIAGLLPMAIGLPEFSLRWSPFATAFIAGLTVSTGMTLLIIPLLYSMTDHAGTRLKNIAGLLLRKKQSRVNQC